MEFLKKITKKQKQYIAIGISVVVVIVLIVMVLNIDNKTSLPVDGGTTTQPENIPNDTIFIENIVNEINDTEVEVISNKNNEQADIILDSVGVDIKDIYSYAASIDPKTDSAHAIIVIRPKEEEKTGSKKALTDYVALKQKYFLENNLEESELYTISKEAIVYEKDEYLVLVMEKDSRVLLDKVLKSIEENKIKLDNEVVD